MKLKTLVFGTAVLLGFSTYSLAYTITADSTNINVGGLDNGPLLEANLSDSSIEYETSWVQGYLGASFTILDALKVEDPAPTVIEVNEDSSLGAFSLSESPAYFLVKKGNGQKSDGNSHWLFENTASLDWGVVNFASLFGENWNEDHDFDISHVVEFTGDIPVPEPGTLALIVTGVAGLFAARRNTRRTS